MKVKSSVLRCPTQIFNDVVTHAQLTYVEDGQERIINVLYLRRHKVGFVRVAYEDYPLADWPELADLCDGYGWDTRALDNFVNSVIALNRALQDGDDEENGDDDVDDEWGSDNDDDQPPIPGLPPMSLGEKYLRSIVF